MSLARIAATATMSKLNPSQGDGNGGFINNGGGAMHCRIASLSRAHNSLNWGSVHVPSETGNTMLLIQLATMCTNQTRSKSTRLVLGRQDML